MEKNSERTFFWTDILLTGLAGISVVQILLISAEEIIGYSLLPIYVLLLLPLFIVIFWVWQKRSQGSGLFLSFTARLSTILLFTIAITAHISASSVYRESIVTSNGNLVSLDFVESEMQKLINDRDKAFQSERRAIRALQLALQAKEIRLLAEIQSNANDRKILEEYANGLEKQLELEMERNSNQTENNGQNAASKDLPQNSETDTSRELFERVVVPPDVETVLKRSNRGQTVLDSIADIALGPSRLLASMMGIGTRTVKGTRRVLRTISQGGQIPSEADLYFLFSVTQEPIELRRNLEALADEAVRRGIMSQEDRENLQALLARAEINPSLELDEALLPAYQLAASSEVCPEEEILRIYPKFSREIVKVIQLTRISNETIRSCLNVIPPEIEEFNLGSND